MKKFKRFLKRNDIIIDFVSKIIFGIFSLILLIIANNLVKEQTKVEKEDTAPMFYITKTNDLKGKKDVYKLENKGGKVSHLKFERIEIFTISVSCDKHEQTIYYPNVLDEKKVNKKNVWYFSPKQKYIEVERFRLNIINALENRYPNKNIIVTYPISYYKITYHDYLNNYKEDYYYDFENYVTYSSEKSIKTNENNDNLTHQSSGGISATFKNDEEFTKVYIQYIFNHYDKHLEYEKKEV